MKIQAMLTNLSLKLQDISLTPRLDAEVLLGDTLRCSKAWIYAHGDEEIPSSLEAKLNKIIVRRLNGEPIAYIRGLQEFYGHEFMVNKHVLTPRPESEGIIEALLSFEYILHAKTLTVIDIGTGSGCLAITAYLELAKIGNTEAKVYAVDVDSSALVVAQKNASRHKARIKFFKGNLLKPVLMFDPILSDPVILANLPYVPIHHEINNSASFEPHVALFGGEDGLDYFRKLFSQLTRLPGPHCHVITESLPFQHADLIRIAEEHGYSELQEKDLIQVFSLN